MSGCEERPEQTPENSELEQVRAALAGSRDAFDRIFERHFPRVFSLAHQGLGSDAAAEAATAAVFETLVNLLPAFRGERPLATWIATLAQHEIESRRLPHRAIGPADRRPAAAYLP